jgi:hypothetical protein
MGIEPQKMLIDRLESEEEHDEEENYKTEVIETHLIERNLPLGYWFEVICSAKRTLFLLNIQVSHQTSSPYHLISYLYPLIPHLKLRSYSYFINHYNLVVEKLRFIYTKNEK